MSHFHGNVKLSWECHTFLGNVTFLKECHTFIKMSNFQGNVTISRECQTFKELSHFFKRTSHFQRNVTLNFFKGSFGILYSNSKLACTPCHTLENSLCEKERKILQLYTQMIIYLLHSTSFYMLLS